MLILNSDYLRKAVDHLVTGKIWYMVDVTLKSKIIYQLSFYKNISIFLLILLN